MYPSAVPTQIVPSGATPAGATNGAPASKRKRAVGKPDVWPDTGRRACAEGDAASPDTTLGSKKNGQISKECSFTPHGSSLVREKHQPRAGSAPFLCRRPAAGVTFLGWR